MRFTKHLITASLIVAATVLPSSCTKKADQYQFETFAATDSILLANNEKSPQCHVTVNIDYPVAVPDGVNLEELNDFIQFVTLDTTNHVSVKEAYKSYLSGITADYEALRPDYNRYNTADDRAPFASFSWQMSIQGKASFPNKSMLSYEVTFYTFTGGAHGMEVVKHYIFNKSTGTQMSYEDLFRSDAHGELTTLISEQALQQYEQEQFFDTFFINDRLTIEPSRDIRFTETGVDFIYQRYDIAPYSTGLVVISLPMSKVLPLLNKEIADAL